MIVVIDSIGANLASVSNAVKREGVDFELTSDLDKIQKASHVIFPGVGAAASAMIRVKEMGLNELIPKLKQPFLGICLGMQLLFSGSEEGDVPCLGVVEGSVKRFQLGDSFTVPHMGWNQVSYQPHSRLFKKIDPESYFYFVHSYHAPEVDEIVATTEYGTNVPVAFEKDNFFGVQFHPEKSASVGAQLIRNFLTL